MVNNVTREKEITEMCDDLLHEVGGLNKIDLFYRTIHDASKLGSINKKETNSLYKGLQKIAHVCNIELGIPRLK